MKRLHLTMAGLILFVCFSACNESGTSNSTNDSGNMTNSDSANASNNATNNNTANAQPLSKEDSTFVMKAAIGGLMEVQSGTLAQQKATNDRVKAFGTMMVNDHTAANNELMSLASGRGISLPTDLPPDMKKHMEEMQKMEGKTFDKHYMSMMVNDHQKTIADFEKQANSGADANLKAWAAKTLPVLQMHRDSATAINKSKL